jgi:hypothetical protein
MWGAPVGYSQTGYATVPEMQAAHWSIFGYGPPALMAPVSVPGPGEAARPAARAGLQGGPGDQPDASPGVKGARAGALLAVGLLFMGAVAFVAERAR